MGRIGARKTYLKSMQQSVMSSSLLALPHPPRWRGVYYVACAQVEPHADPTSAADAGSALPFSALSLRPHGVLVLELSKTTSSSPSLLDFFSSLATPAHSFFHTLFLQQRNRVSDRIPSQQKGLSKHSAFTTVAMVLHNPNNWHWVNKDVSVWARQWFDDKLTKIEAKEGDVSAKITKVISMDGDVDVAQRKGKVITIFDVKLTLEYSGSTAEDDNVSGTITVPEVSHELEEDEFVFEIDIYSDAKEKQPVKDLVRSKIVPQLRSEFLKLSPALIAEHGKDIQHAPGSNPSSGFPTPKYHAPTPAPAKVVTTTTQKNSGSIVNTTTVTDTEEFRTTAAELFQTFTDPQRLAAFTRAPPKVFDGAKEGGKFELFGGNVSGEYLELVEPTKIVQSWRLDQWPKGHYSTLQIEFDQNDVDSVTVMRVEWTGVPVGQEEVTKRNWLEYYVKSIKRTFGFGTVL
ncbi:activator of Hsp90 ATPase [Podospora aff. communis PSN243]|uniref:Activator of Hsp90 ATPase n=1 Tax=Podospora aff. communis PSN243 TaxID=3040156 RepID=A0AAV9G7B6_9PEZI|nr:activator of Hsp90 ATPase [Podospora aff. communis PSN243]